MAAHKWTNTGADCSKTFVTFDENVIRFHYPNGDYDFGNIVDVQEYDNGQVGLTVEPSNMTKEAAKRDPSSNRLPNAAVMGFQLTEISLKLVAVVSGKEGEVGGAVSTDSMEYRLFDLNMCKA
ncbi:hypothetical protein GCM10009106_10690 [Sphingomonas japonica]